MLLLSRSAVSLVTLALLLGGSSSVGPLAPQVAS